jgi:hypothetical protein
MLLCETGKMSHSRNIPNTKGEGNPNFEIFLILEFYSVLLQSVDVLTTVLPGTNL